MRKFIFTSWILLLVTGFSSSLYAGKADKIKYEFMGSTNGWSYPADHNQGVMEITPENYLRIIRTGSDDWFMMQKTITVDFDLYPELAVRLVKELEQGRWFFKIEKDDFWKELLVDNSYMAEIPGADDDYLNSIYVWDIRSILREEGIPVTEPVTLNLQFTLQQTEPGNSIELDWIRSDYNDDKIDPADDVTKVQVTGTLVDNMESAQGWSVLAGGELIAENGTVGIRTTGPDAWSILHKSFSEDVTKYPFLAAKIADFNRGWELKFSSEQVEKVLDAGNASESGAMYVWNLTEITELSGKQDFSIQIVAKDGTDSYVTVDWIRSQNYISPSQAKAEKGNINDQMESADGWRNIDAGEIFTRNGTVGVRAMNGSTQGWYVIRKDYMENVDEYPYLRVTVADFNEDWTVKVVTSDGEKELLKENAIQNGKVYTWNLQRQTGTNGTNNYGVQLLALGTSGSTYFTVDAIESYKYIDDSNVGINDPKEQTVSVYTQNGKIIVNMENKTNLQVVDLLGRVVFAQNLETGMHEIPVPQAGIYVVVAGTSKAKIVVQ